MKILVTASRNQLIIAPSLLTILNDSEMTTELVGMNQISINRINAQSIKPTKV